MGASAESSAACFASSTQADLTSDGFKLIGSAQVWKDDTLCNRDHSRSMTALLSSSQCCVSRVKPQRKDALALYAEKTTPLHAFAPEAPWDAVAGAFKSDFPPSLTS